MSVTPPAYALVRPASSTSTAVPASPTSAQLDRLTAYCVDYACGLDPYTSGWKAADGSYRLVRFTMGSWVTPRKDSGLADIGAPHLVLESFHLPALEFVVTGAGNRLDGARRDMRVVKLVAANNLLGPQAFWVESIDFEPYVAPASVTLPDVKLLLKPFVDAGTFLPLANGKAAPAPSA